jgi:hypothetical protein
MSAVRWASDETSCSIALSTCEAAFQLGGSSPIVCHVNVAIQRAVWVIDAATHGALVPASLFTALVRSESQLARKSAPAENIDIVEVIDDDIPASASAYVVRPSPLLGARGVVGGWLTQARLAARAPPLPKRIAAHARFEEDASVAAAKQQRRRLHSPASGGRRCSQPTSQPVGSGSAPVDVDIIGSDTDSDCVALVEEATEPSVEASSSKMEPPQHTQGAGQSPQASPSLSEVINDSSSWPPDMAARSTCRRKSGSSISFATRDDDDVAFIALIVSLSEARSACEALPFDADLAKVSAAAERGQAASPSLAAALWLSARAGVGVVAFVVDAEEEDDGAMIPSSSGSDEASRPLAISLTPASASPPPQSYSGSSASTSSAVAQGATRALSAAGVTVGPLRRGGLARDGAARALDGVLRGFGAGGGHAIALVVEASLGGVAQTLVTSLLAPPSRENDFVVWEVWGLSRAPPRALLAAFSAKELPDNVQSIIDKLFDTIPGARAYFQCSDGREILHAAAALMDDEYWHDLATRGAAGDATASAAALAIARRDAAVAVAFMGVGVIEGLGESLKSVRSKAAKKTKGRKRSRASPESPSDAPKSLPQSAEIVSGTTGCVEWDAFLPLFCGSVTDSAPECADAAFATFAQSCANATKVYGLSTWPLTIAVLVKQLASWRAAAAAAAPNRTAARALPTELEMLTLARDGWRKMKDTQAYLDPAAPPRPLTLVAAAAAAITITGSKIDS